MVNIKSLWESQNLSGDIIKRIRIDEIKQFSCFAGVNYITGNYLYIMSFPASFEFPDLKNHRFKSVEIFWIESESSKELNIYLLDNELKDIFTLFIQNILDEVSLDLNETDALQSTLNIVSKWKKLFDKINFNGLSLQQQKGLIGELLFINFLLDSSISKSKILQAWTGVEFDDKDFVFKSVGIEVKMTASKNPRLQITSERQLDTLNLSELYLVLYSTEEVKHNGFSLNSLIAQIRQKLAPDIDEVKYFNERLSLLGYLDDDVAQYNKMYAMKQEFTFAVTEGFPRILKSELPTGVYDTSYLIELSATEEFLVDQGLILSKI